VVELNPDRKMAGVLVPVFALRGDHDLGIGDVEALREFADWAADIGLSVIQILPVNETGCDNSPYNIISSMAIDPATIATTPALIPELAPDDYEAIVARHDVAGLRAGPVNYRGVKALKAQLLRAAFQRFQAKSPGASPERRQAFVEFVGTHGEWLEPYALYRALMAMNGESEVLGNWPPEHQSLETAHDWAGTLPAAGRRRLQRLMRFYSYVQWVAFSQWQDVRAHCNARGVSLMGDVPVGVSIYSCDVWSEPGIFDLLRSSGAPPEKVFQSDPFTMKWGQNWGFPLYEWREMSRDNFAWWRRRLRAMFGMFDFVRVDHALGFFRIYSFPWRPEQNAAFLDLTEDEARELTGGHLPGFVPRDDSTSEHEEMNRRHGETLFRIMLEETGPHRLIAEDLGSVAPYVRPTLEELEIPGFKIPQWERNGDGSYIPGAEYQRLSLATYATHDHAPVRAFWSEWFADATSADERKAEAARFEMGEMMKFAGRPDLAEPRPFSAEIHTASMRGLLASNSWLAIPMITDILGTADRFNVPGAIGDQNWTSRLDGNVAHLSQHFAPQIEAMAKIIVETNRRQN
jgi:4-alpha-glucanotransferase